MLRFEKSQPDKKKMIADVYMKMFKIPYGNNVAKLDVGWYAIPAPYGCDNYYSESQARGTISEHDLKKVKAMFDKEMDFVHPRDNTIPLRIAKVEKLWMKLYMKNQRYEEQRLEALRVQDEEEEDKSEDEEQDGKLRTSRKRRRFKISKKRPRSPPRDPRRFS